ncbi:MAG: hypothetical protein U0802_15755 [Candidatus Binatia bacterium]
MTVPLSRPIRETVENYGRLARHFRGSRWARFFVGSGAYQLNR